MMRGSLSGRYPFLPASATARLRHWLDPRPGAATDAEGDDQGQLLSQAMTALDALLRRHYGVVEFSSAPECVLRLASDTAGTSMVLGDGTRIELGETVGVLHLWNERMPRFSRNGPDLRWAKTIGRRMRFSFNALARYVEANDAWHGVRAFRADAAFGGRLGLEQMRHVAVRYGFDALEPERSLSRQMHDLCENALIWGMVAAFNPGGLGRHRLLRDRFELWVSRRTLVERYGDGIGPPAAD